MLWSDTNGAKGTCAAGSELLRRRPRAAMTIGKCLLAATSILPSGPFPPSYSNPTAVEQGVEIAASPFRSLLFFPFPLSLSCPIVLFPRSR